MSDDDTEFHAEVVDPADVDGPIHVVPATWDDEKPHELGADWTDSWCWCEPTVDGKYVRHVSVFDAFDAGHLLEGEAP